MNGAEEFAFLALVAFCVILASWLLVFSKPARKDEAPTLNTRNDRDER